MLPLTRRIALLASGFSLVLGLFLLGSNLMLIPQRAREVAVGLWPLLLIVAGILLVVDSFRKRRYTRSTLSQSRSFPLPLPPGSGDLLCRVGFSYGRLRIAAAPDAPSLVVQQFGSSGDPSLEHETRGATAVLALGMAKPLFPTSFQLHNRWQLGLPAGLPISLELNLHEADLVLDLRRLTVESLEVRADSGEQSLQLAGAQKKLDGRVYSSASTLAITLPSRAYSRVILLNPFCKIDYPQGDFERREDGSFVSLSPEAGPRSVELSVDGPIKNLVLDVEDAETPET
jgi:hypothetical protein